MAYQLEDFPSRELKGLDPQFPDDGIFSLDEEKRWQLFFDGAANKRGNGVGMLLVDPKDEQTPIDIKLNFEVTNNAAKYEACVAGLEAALECNIKKLEVFGDSALMINQVSNRWKTIDPGLQKYHAYIEELVAQFKEGIKAKSMVALKRLASHFVILGGMLYKKHHQGPLLRCVSEEKSIELMNETHNGACGPT